MWLRTILSCLIILFLCSCGTGEKPARLEQDTTSESPAGRSSNAGYEMKYLQVCDSCNWRIMEIPQIDAIPTDTFKITEPTAIAFFYLAGRKDWYDSLDDHHQTYYNTIDQYGRFVALMSPWLKDHSIAVIDPPPNRSVLFFEDNKHEYIIDVHPYYSKDGVLMFNPGKVPVFWTADALAENCADSTFLSCYFLR